MSIQDLKYHKPLRPQNTDDLRRYRANEKVSDKTRAEIRALQDKIAELENTIEELQSQ